MNRFFTGMIRFIAANDFLFRAEVFGLNVVVVLLIAIQLLLISFGRNCLRLLG